MVEPPLALAWAPDPLHGPGAGPAQRRLLIASTHASVPATNAETLGTDELRAC